MFKQLLIWLTFLPSWALSSDLINRCWCSQWLVWTDSLFVGYCRESSMMTFMFFKSINDQILITINLANSIPWGKTADFCLKIFPKRQATRNVTFPLVSFTPCTQYVLLFRGNFKVHIFLGNIGFPGLVRENQQLKTGEKSHVDSM